MPKATPKQRRKFTSDEDEAIKSGHEKYKDCWNKWSMILGDPQYGATLSTRSNMQIKDRFVTIQASRTKVTNALREYSASHDDIDNNVPVTWTQRSAVPNDLQLPPSWDQAEIRAIAEVIKRHGNGKGVQHLLNKVKLECQQKLRNKKPNDIELFLSTLRSTPEICTEVPFPVCMKCRKYTQCDGQDGEVELPQNDVGKRYGRYMLVCKPCHTMAVLKLQAFFSPRSGCTLDRQVSFLRLLYDTQIPPYFAAELIEMDHDPSFKSDALSNMKTTNAFIAEVLQGRCVAILSQEHALVSRRSNSSSASSNDEHKQLLVESRKMLEKTLTQRQISTLFGDHSLDKFKASGLFWGVDRHGSRRFDDCEVALKQLWTEELNRADSGNDEQSLALQWFIKLGHDRVKIVHNNVDRDNLPPDYLRIEQLLEKWSVTHPPFKLLGLKSCM